ncbi:hypothetical protein B0J18DRAFT_439569 [Chaetomium sp. MPI-SDFR-AT-0129]|nr:hypothetical protein B0J18DRAFT_439569 [Chaetomium sp. MPI-SDFR-AT-0129]
MTLSMRPIMAGCVSASPASSARGLGTRLASSRSRNAKRLSADVHGPSTHLQPNVPGPFEAPSGEGPSRAWVVGKVLYLSRGRSIEYSLSSPKTAVPRPLQLILAANNQVEQLQPLRRSGLDILLVSAELRDCCSVSSSQPANPDKTRTYFIHPTLQPADRSSLSDYYHHFLSSMVGAGE